MVLTQLGLPQAFGFFAARGQTDGINAKTVTLASALALPTVLVSIALLPIIRAGHERWDGRGYPDGLAGEEIPLGARIIFVCDAFDAMTSDRSYRPALPDDEALRRLKEASGTQFDPVVVHVFAEAYAAGKIRPHAHAS